MLEKYKKMWQDKEIENQQSIGLNITKYPTSDRKTDLVYALTVTLNDFFTFLKSKAAEKANVSKNNDNEGAESGILEATQYISKQDSLIRMADKDLEREDSTNKRQRTGWESTSSYEKIMIYVSILNGFMRF